MESIKTFVSFLIFMEVIDQKRKGKESRITYQPIGWRSLLQIRAGTSRILILKTVVRGLCMEKGMPIYSYVCEDQEGRPLMVSYLDGKPKIEKTSGEDTDER